MYSKRCSQIIRMHTGPLTCLAVTDDQLILCIKVASVSSDRTVDSLTPFRFTGVSSLCFNPNSSLLFAGSTAGFVNCWDLRTMSHCGITELVQCYLFSATLAE
ncbi:hypothetical protein Scep_019684 [Stephania cephalantha]|uniref:Uncharacterized protein n=1 Tax=Stephania cephalantha TaxID=152367 RepID=A0AAP0NNJ5_9MAGN